MSVSMASVDQWLRSPLDFDALIDVRSPSEFADDHLPGAVNWPVLDDEERARVGTVYKQVSTFEARKLGAALVARRIADWLEAEVADKPKTWRPLIYCWRGGQRSGSLSLVLSQVGFKTHQLVGGYKSFRGRVLAELARQTETLQVVLVRGRTGSGKTRLLQALAAEGGQILDLEALAAHRGSVLGGLPGQPQPSQKAFETAIWQRLDELDLRLPVFVESESRRIGALHLPNPLMLRMQQASRVIHVEMPVEARIALLLDDYRSLTTAPEDFCACIQGLMGLQSRATVAHWQSLAREGGWLQLLTELLQQHYDPLYDRHAPKETVSGPRHEHLRLPSHDAASLAAAAQALLHATPGEP